VLLPGHPAAVDGLGDGVDANNVPFRQMFPYVALPNQKAVNQSWNPTECSSGPWRPTCACGCAAAKAPRPLDPAHPGHPKEFLP
jgi:radical SAM protein with 4Fe4S-binding SPASM domain